MKIFICDDDAFCMNLYHQQLQLLGYRDVSLYNTSAGCMTALSGNPDVVLVDQNLDPLRGLEILKMIKRKNPWIYVVFICSSEETAVALQSLRYGAFDFVLKGQNELESIRKIMLKITEVRSFFEQQLYHTGS